MTPRLTIVVDWSGGNDRGPRPKADAIWIARDGQDAVYLRNRQVAEVWLHDAIADAINSNIPLLIGFDFPFGYPRGFARALCNSDDPLDLWAWFADHIQDSPSQNNRFDIAGQINARFAGVGPFWGNGLRRDIPDLPRRGRDRAANPFAERRHVEAQTKGTFTCWQMSGAGSVGGQVMMGLPMLHRLRHAFSEHIRVWPFEPAEKLITFAEVWPSLVTGPAPQGMIKDAHQVITTASHFAHMPAAQFDRALSVPHVAAQEGWILGVLPETTDP